MQLDIKTLCQYRLDRVKADSEIQLKHAQDFVGTVEDYLNQKFNDGNAVC